MNFNLYLFTLLLLSGNLISQNQLANYISYPENNSDKNILYFESDSTVTLRKEVYHSGAQYEIHGDYVERNDSIIIKFTKLESKYETVLDSIDRNSYLTKHITLIKNETELINKKSREVYVSLNNRKRKKIDKIGILIFNRNQYEFKKKRTLFDRLFGFITGSNRKLRRVLDTYVHDEESYKTRTLKGLSAYLEYGICGLGGVFIIEQKE